MLLTPLNVDFFFINFTEIVNTSPHEVPDRNIFGKHIISGGAGGKGQHRKGMQGRKSYVMKFLVDFALYTVYL